MPVLRYCHSEIRTIGAAARRAAARAVHGAQTAPAAKTIAVGNVGKVFGAPDATTMPALRTREYCPGRVFIELLFEGYAGAALLDRFILALGGDRLPAPRPVIWGL